MAVFVCLLAHSARKMVLIVPPGDWPRVVGRARVPLPSLMTMGSASWAASVPGRLEIPSGRGSDEAPRGPLGVTVVSGCSQRVPAAQRGSVQRVAARSGVGSGDGGRVKRRAPAWLSPHSHRLGGLLSPRLPRPLLGPPGVGRASRVRWCAPVADVVAASLSSHARFRTLTACPSVCQRLNLNAGLMPAGTVGARSVPDPPPGAPVTVLEGMALLVLKVGCGHPAWEVLGREGERRGKGGTGFKDRRASGCWAGDRAVAGGRGAARRGKGACVVWARPGVRGLSCGCGSAWLVLSDPGPAGVWTQTLPPSRRGPQGRGQGGTSTAGAFSIHLTAGPLLFLLLARASWEGTSRGSIQPPAPTWDRDPLPGGGENQTLTWRAPWPCPVHTDHQDRAPEWGPEALNLSRCPGPTLSFPGTPECPLQVSRSRCP